MKGLVLVTGSAGRLGRAVMQELRAGGYAVRGFDRTAAPDSIVGSVQDAADVSRAMAGVTTLIHLAATPDDTDDFAELMANNVAGLHHVMEAARDAGVRRLVLASSGQVNDTQQRDGPFPIRAEEPITPRYWYAATKMFMESIGYSFSQRHGMSVVIVRLGWCPRTREQVEEIASAERYQDVYLSPGDAGRFFRCVVEAPESLRWAILYATSRPPRQVRFDIESARRLIGYEPREQWPLGIEIVLQEGTPGKTP